MHGFLVVIDIWASKEGMHVSLVCIMYVEQSVRRAACRNGRDDVSVQAGPFDWTSITLPR